MNAILLLALVSCKADDPTFTVPVATPPATPPPSPELFCGDGLIDPTEACDDGVNDGSYGGCLADCSGLAPHCGDGAIDAVEVCDDGDNFGQYGGCMPGCGARAAFCGDGVVDLGEACDDGVNDDAYGGCASDCLAEAGRCGDGVISGPEACDDGVNDGSYDTCTSDCLSRASFCGDGVVDPAEACDDGVNDGQYGGCVSGCQVLASFCGDGILDASEVCDDGVNIGLYEGCNTGCQSLAGTCGDGIRQPEEVCDDGVNDLLAGGCRPGCQFEDLSDQVYDIDRVLDIDLEVDPAEFEILRRQFRDTFQMFEGEDCHTRPTGTFKPYYWLEAEVTIDGEDLGTVGMRKKGGFGSVRYTKPALKLDFDRYEDDKNFESLEHMTLNNNLNDVSLVRQCLAYDAFRLAGLPAARCNFATVSVNGEDLGLYINIEPMKKNMVRYHFGNETGNLYEGWISDFNDKFFGTYDQDLNADVDDSFSDMRAVLDAMDSDDADLEAALEPHLDVDHFYRFWAMEVLTWQHDGYTANSNNHYLYNDPDRGKLVFLPWGMDHGMHANDNASFPDTGRLQGAIPQRFWNHPPAQARFVDTLRDMSENAWDVDALLERLERYHAAVISATPPESHAEIIAETEVVREYIRNRPQQIAEILAEPLADIPVQPRLSRCMNPVGVAQLSITDSSWSAVELGPFETCDTEGSLSLTLNGQAIQGDAGLTCRSGIHNVNDRHYFQQRYTEGDLRYTTSFLFPRDGDFFLGSGLYTEPVQWSASIIVRDLVAAENIRRLRIDPAAVRLEGYEQVEGAPVTATIDGILWEDVEY